ncbi:OsmC family protein [Streptomyces sp. NPDC094149]|uniref:OsmC family protein n=1 Tax=Streptomyces sp. NPDC094149 TaxID=3155079 RepID=UPI00331AEBBC
MPARVTVRENGFPTQVITIGPHALTADEPAPVGQDTGPTPVDLLLAALGACTSMTVRMYAKRHGWSLTAVEVDVRLDRTQSPRGRIVKDVRLYGELEPEHITRLNAVADACPVHRILSDPLPITSQTVLASPVTA